MMSMCRRLDVLAALVLLVCTTTMNSFPSVDAFSTTRPSRRSSTRIQMARKQCSKLAANEMALKIGLNIVPPKVKITKNRIDGGVKQKKKKVKLATVAPPVISWGSEMERFFWPNTTPGDENTKAYHIANKESFPLVLIPGALSGEYLAQALALTTNDIRELEELEQHEMISDNKRVHTLRRSLVSQLSTGDELLDGILSQLPTEIEDGLHPYEDGSVVYYRAGDFYDEHHDSYSPRDESHRLCQRAYTVLLYLRTPPGPPSIGGTEFTRITPLPASESNVKQDSCIERKEGGSSSGLIVKPSAGDLLIWPNFDRDGYPYKESLHRALPVQVASSANGSVTQDSEIAKVVVNLWFEGSRQKIKVDAL